MPLPPLGLLTEQQLNITLDLDEPCQQHSHMGAMPTLEAAAAILRFYCITRSHPRNLISYRIRTPGNARTARLSVGNAISPRDQLSVRKEK